MTKSLDNYFENEKNGTFSWVFRPQWTTTETLTYYADLGAEQDNVICDLAPNSNVAHATRPRDKLAQHLRMRAGFELGMHPVWIP